MELSGRLAIMTGASRGIGRALARELAKFGCNLLLTALEPEELSSLASELRSRSPICVATMAANLSESADRKNLIDWIILILGRGVMPSGSPANPFNQI